MDYLVVVEKGPTSWGAHVPDLPGCVAAAETREEVRALIREAIECHIEGLIEDGLPVPPADVVGRTGASRGLIARSPQETCRSTKDKNHD